MSLFKKFSKKHKSKEESSKIDEEDYKLKIKEIDNFLEKINNDY